MAAKQSRWTGWGGASESSVPFARRRGGGGEREGVQCVPAGTSLYLPMLEGKLIEAHLPASSWRLDGRRERKNQRKLLQCEYDSSFSA